jgi:hypothetical protein
MELFNSIPMIRVAETTEINKVFVLYENARPDANMLHSYCQPDAMQNGGSNITQEVLAEMGTNMVIAEVGALGGQHGVVAVVGVTLLNNVWRAITGVNENHEKVYFNLYYLKPEQLAINTSGDMKQKLNLLQTLYDYCYQYQQLKSERPGFLMPVIGWKCGEYREENKIDDFKYLINIFIGRKLKLAAEALKKGDQDNYTNHLDHLFRFLEAIAKEPDFLWSRSDDTSYISLRNVINMVKMDLITQQVSEQNNSEGSRLLGLFEQHLVETRNKSEKVLRRTEDRLINLLCMIAPDDFRNHTNLNSFNKNLEVNKEIEVNPYVHFLYQALFNYPKDGIDSELNQTNFMKGLSDFTGLKIKDINSVIYTQFCRIATLKNQISQLFSMFALYDQIKKNGGYVGLICIIDETEFLLTKIKALQDILEKEVVHFVEILTTEIYPTSNQTFKNKFTVHGWVRSLSYVEPLNNAILTLKMLVMYKREVQEEIINNLKKNIGLFNDAVQQVGYTDVRSITNLQESLVSSLPSIESNNDNEKAVQCMENWVRSGLVSVDREAFRNALPNDIKSELWFQNILWEIIQDKEVQLKELQQAQEKKQERGQLQPMLVDSSEHNHSKILVKQKEESKIKREHIKPPVENKKVESWFQIDDNRSMPQHMYSQIPYIDYH